MFITKEEMKLLKIKTVFDVFAIKSYITNYNNTNLHNYLRQHFELGH